MKAGRALVSQCGLLDGTKLSTGVQVWLLGWMQAEPWCPDLACWNELKLRSGVPVWLARRKQDKHQYPRNTEKLEDRISWTARVAC